tara:strand:- start:71 stop:757 length:687 start_codon:yes stop_codon:yes gene_type:complete
MSLKNIGLSILGLYLLNSNDYKKTNNSNRQTDNERIANKISDVGTVNLESIAVNDQIENEVTLTDDYKKEIKAFQEQIKNYFEDKTYFYNDDKQDLEAQGIKLSDLATSLINDFEVISVVFDVLSDAFLNPDIIANNRDYINLTLKKILTDDIQNINYAIDINNNKSIIWLKCLEAAYTLKIVVLSIMFGKNPLNEENLSDYHNKNFAKFEFVNKILIEIAEEIEAYI